MYIGVIIDSCFNMVNIVCFLGNVRYLFGVVIWIISKKIILILILLNKVIFKLKMKWRFLYNYVFLKKIKGLSIKL